MKKLLKRLPKHIGLWVPVLVLPLLIGEIWLHAAGLRPNPGAALSMGVATALVGWYFLGGGLALAHAREGLMRRRQLSRLQPALDAARNPEWAVDSAGLILAQSAAAQEIRGDFVGRPLAHVLSSHIADAEGEADRLLTRTLRHGKYEIPLQNGNAFRAERVGSKVVHLHFVSCESAQIPDPMDYDKLPVAILRLSGDGVILRANRAAWSYCGDGASGQHVSKLLDGLGRPFEGWLAEALKSRQPLPPEVLRAPKAGPDRFIQISLHPEEGTEGTLIAVLSDARALKTLEAQFVQSQKMQAIGQLAGGIAHDFNNLLTAISGHCDLLMLRHDKGDPDYADLDQISQNANRAANLVSHLLAFSRKQTLKPQLLDMREAISDLSHLLNRLVGEKITLDFRHDPGLETVRADRSKIEQVIMNLVVNARDAMPDGGCIDISTQNLDLEKPLHQGRFAVPAGRYVQVTVADQGCGIAPELQGKIFEPFFTTKRIGEGTGLGLSTAYGIVKQTGGYILCESAVGVGTAFTIFLPVHSGSEQPMDDVALPLPEATANAGQMQHVLLVEDEEPVRAFASRALKLRGYKVTEASSGEQALSLLTDNRLQIELIVSDVVMPGLDGVSWVRQALKDRPGTRVIFMSGYTEDVFEDGRNPVEGASFLQKPFSLSDLIAAVAGELNRAA